MTVTVAAEESIQNPIEVRPVAAAASGSPIPQDMPASIPADELYYWSFPWQDDVRKSLAALQAGDFEEFGSDDPDDVVRWLLSTDD